MLEGALTLTAFTFLLVGVFDFGQFLFMHHSLVERARWASRTGAVKKLTGDEIRNLIAYGTASPTTTQKGSPGYFGLSAANIAVSFENSDSNASRIVVSISNLSFPVISPLIAGNYRNMPVRLAFPIEEP